MLNETELAERIEALLQANDFGLPTWGSFGGTTQVFTYRFELAPAADFPWNNVGGGFSPFTNAEKAVFAAVLAEYSTFINVSFVEDNVASDVNFSFYRAADLYTDSPGSASGRGRWQYFGSEWDASSVYRSDIDLTSASNFDLVLHEIGHMFGMKHPGDYDVGGNNPPGPFLPTAEDSDRYTVMSYNINPVSNQESRHLMLYDIAALQAFWGVNTSTRTGNDVYTGPDDGRIQVIWDAGGIDTIQHEGPGGAVIDLRSGYFSSLGSIDNFAVAYGAEIENATGGSDADTINGNDLSNLIYGRGGSDVISGNGGIDYLFGDGGNDTINGNDGADWLYGGDNNDTLNGGAGADLMFGEAGFDIMNGGADGDYMWGGSENDVMHGDDGADWLRGEDGLDYLYGDAGDDVLIGGAGNDQLIGGTGTDTFYGEGDNDTINGMENGDVAFGQEGDDIINGWSEGDFLFGGNGADTINGGTENDLMWGAMPGQFDGATDTFEFDAGWGFDAVYDFELGVDEVRFNSIAGLTQFSNLTLYNGGANVTIGFGADAVTFYGVTQAELEAHSGDFSFS